MEKTNFSRRFEGCIFCSAGENPDFKKLDQIRRFITDRGKIVSRRKSGVCAKHQRRLAREIKRARHLALLPFITRV